MPNEPSEQDRTVMFVRLHHTLTAWLGLVMVNYTVYCHRRLKARGRGAVQWMTQS